MMKGDERFERNLRESLQHDARGPAPERLVAAVARIPEAGSGDRRALAGRRSWTGVRYAGLAAAALGVAVLAILARPGAVPPPVGGTPSSTAAAPSAGASATVDASASPADGTSVPGSGAPEPTPVPGGPTPVPGGPTPRVGGPLPSGFQPISATFVSADDGRVLGSVPCGVGRCVAIARTTDGGTTWTSSGAPDTTLAAAALAGSDAGVSAIRFADAVDGWVFGPELWATHDGGATWIRLALPGLAPGASVVALEAAHGRVHAVAYDGHEDFRIVSSPIAGDDWTVSPTGVPVGAGPVPMNQLVLSGANGWILENDRVVTAGARLVDGAWDAWQPPCLNTLGPAILDASTPSELVAVCDVGLMGTPQGEHVFVSHGAGATFGQVDALPPVRSAQAVATASSTTIVIAGSGPATSSVLVASFDGGSTWSTVSSVGPVSFADLGFTTDTHGFVLTRSASGAGQMLATRDGGRTWEAVRF